MSRRTLLEFFHAYEKEVGIAHEPGRGWYGIRRRSTDRVRRVTDDERVRDASGGWTPGSSTRARVYMDGEDPEVLTETAAAREEARGRVLDGGEAPPQPDLASVLRASGLPEEKIQAILVLASPSS